MQPFPKLTENEAANILANLTPVLERLVAEPGYTPKDATEEFAMLLWASERIKRADFSDMECRFILRLAGIRKDEFAALWQWYSRYKKQTDPAGVVAELERWLRNGLGVRDKDSGSPTGRGC